jgi:hypothetical protein
MAVSLCTSVVSPYACTEHGVVMPSVLNTERDLVVTRA